MEIPYDETEVMDGSMRATYDEVQDEDDRYRAMNKRRTEWWMADLDYLPIHFFRKNMRKFCYELSTKNVSRKRMMEIIQNVEAMWTEQMKAEFRDEYEFSYGPGVIDWSSYQGRLVQGGYMTDLKLYLAKLLCVYVQCGTTQDRQTLWQSICRVHDTFFRSQRCWKDDELDRFDHIILTIRRRIHPHPRTLR